MEIQKLPYLTIVNKPKAPAILMFIYRVAEFQQYDDKFVLDKLYD